MDYMDGVTASFYYDKIIVLPTKITSKKEANYFLIIKFVAYQTNNDKS